ncbi:DUF4249 family protein [Dyadobacter psychrotolerans]
MKKNKNVFKRSFFYVVISFVAILMCIGCEKNINVKIQPYQGMLSIQCMLVAGEVPRLYLSQSTGFFSSQITPADLFVPGARVIISSPETRDSLITTMGRDSFYCQDTYFYQGKFQVKQGLTYTMEVSYEGKTYRSTTTVNQLKPKIDQVGYISAFKDIYGEHEGVVVGFTDTPGQVNAYRVEMSRQIDSSARKTETAYKSECNGAHFFTVKEVGRAIYFDTGSGDGRQVSVTVEPTYSHRKGSIAQVYLQAMDPSSARFFDQLDKQKLATSNPFVEPVFLTSNIEGCIGVFGHYIRSKPVQFIYPE